MSQTQTTASRRAIWFTIVNATEDPPALPIPYNVSLLEGDGQPSIASLTFHTALDAQAWAIWVDREHTTSWGDNGTVMFFGGRMGWRWNLSCHKHVEQSLTPQVRTSRGVDGSDRDSVPAGVEGYAIEGRAK